MARPRRPRASRLPSKTEPLTSGPCPPGTPPSSIRAGADGSVALLLNGQVKASLKRGARVDDRSSRFEDCAHGLVGFVRPSWIAADGACWFISLSPDSGLELTRLEDGGSAETVTATDLGFTAEHTLTHMAISDDGALWVLVAGTTDGRVEGALTYDGQTWAFIPFEKEAVGSPLDISVAPDGTVWLVSSYGDDELPGLQVARWDGELWTTIGSLDLPRIPDPGSLAWGPTHFLSDGTVWFGGAAARFDGTSLERIDTGDPGLFLDDLVFAPSGAAWALGGAEGGLYVITPEAVAAIEG